MLQTKEKKKVRACNMRANEKRVISMKQYKRNKEVHVRFSEPEYNFVIMHAKASGKSTSEYVRCSVLNKDAVHITDGKEVARKLERLRNVMVQCHNALDVRMDELKESVQAYTAMMQEFGQGRPCSPTVQDTAKLMNMRVEAAVNIISHAYGEVENQVEEKLQQIFQKVQ